MLASKGFFLQRTVNQISTFLVPIYICCSSYPAEMSMIRVCITNLLANFNYIYYSLPKLNLCSENMTKLWKKYKPYRRKRVILFPNQEEGSVLRTKYDAIQKQLE